MCVFHVKIDFRTNNFKMLTTLPSFQEKPGFNNQIIKFLSGYSCLSWVFYLAPENQRVNKIKK